MASARLNLPAVFVYGGSILPGQRNGEALDIVSVFEAVGACAAGHDHRRRAGRDRAPGLPDRGQLRRHVHRQHDGVDRRGARACRCPGSASPPAVDRRRDDIAYESGRAVVHLLELGIRPRQIMTKEAFENAIAVTMALGGSTNAVLHLLAIAYEARVDLELDDFNRIGRAGAAHRRHQAPRPYHMADLDRIGGVPVVMQRAARRRAAARRLPDRHRPDHGREPGRARPARARRRGGAPADARRSTPIGGIAVLTGLAGAQGVGGQGGRHRLRPLRGPGPGVRRRGRRPWRRSWPAQIKPATCVVIRYEGPKGGPGHARDAGGDRRHEGGRAGRRLPR